MYTIFLLATHGNGLHGLLETMSRAGLSCLFGSDFSQVADAAESGQSHMDAVLLDVASFRPVECQEIVSGCRNLKMPVLAVIPGEDLQSYDPAMNPDEFILSPMQQEELVARIKQAIYRVNGPTGGQLLKAGDLVIDLEKYDVMMGGRRVSLTYKEFQLLVMLASNPGRVYSRDVLLSQVWGYDYLGGTRTVDVHVRRLRSKIEDPDHSFIETIWNVGYRFRSIN
ncbi:MAG: response regulator transcription factor [Chloroflexota bacterium]|nr:response regulator transcription factor [Chloroflexota bacterium]